MDREELLHAVTALSGSGPAYFFLVMEAMQLAAETLGLEPELSRRLTAQTALGAARMALESDVRVAVALSLVLGAVSVALLLALRAVPSAWASLHSARTPRQEAAP